MTQYLCLRRLSPKKSRLMRISPHWQNLPLIRKLRWRQNNRWAALRSRPLSCHGIVALKENGGGEEVNMSEWVKCSAVNGVNIFVNLTNVLTMSNYGAGTRLALSGNSQTYVDVAETPPEILALPKVSRTQDSFNYDQPLN